MSLAQRLLAGAFATAMAVSPSLAQDVKNKELPKEPVKIAQSFKPAASIDPKSTDIEYADNKAIKFSQENNGRKGVGIALRVGPNVDPAKLQELN